VMDPRSGQEKRCFQVEATDNVATLLCAADPGDRILVQGGIAAWHLDVLEAIALGHKVALVEIPEGAFIVKYGVPIGRSTALIRPGQWVHLHNCRSLVDERSSHLDPLSGAAQDTAYA
jgi:altronate dehydratase small subunit